jgi:hypothetical protein
MWVWLAAGFAAGFISFPLILFPLMYWATTGPENDPR